MKSKKVTLDTITFAQQVLSETNERILTAMDKAWLKQQSAKSKARAVELRMTALQAGIQELKSNIQTETLPAIFKDSP